MPLASLLLAPGLLAVGAALCWGLSLAGVRGGQLACAAAGWLALIVLALVWLGAGRVPVEVGAPFGIAGASLALRLDAVAVVFELVVLLPFALLLSFQPRDEGEAAVAALAAATALLTLEAGSLVLTVFGLGTCASLLLVVLRQEEQAATGRYWLAMTGTWLLLLWAAVLLEVTGGTSAYAAVPVTALQVPIFALLALAAVLCSGLLPWRTWVSEAWTRRRLEAAPLAVALMVPLGFSLLLRAYGLGAGQWPSPGLNLALGALGAGTALAAAVRAQAASTRRGYLAESVPLGGGLALLALALGTPLGVTAAVVTVGGMGLVAGLAPILPEDQRPATLIGIAVAAGVPPTLVFAGWLLALQAAIEASAATGFMALAGAAAWLIGLAAGARSVWLPAAPPGAVEGSLVGTRVGAGAALVAGAGLGVLVSLLAAPAAIEVLAAPGASGAAAGSLSAGALGISTATGGWPALLLAGPLLLLGAAGAALSRWAGAGTAAEAAPGVRQLPPPPLFPPPLAGEPERWGRRLIALRLPDQYRSLFQPAVIEAAAARSRPWFWALITLVLAIAVTR